MSSFTEELYTITSGALVSISDIAGAGGTISPSGTVNVISGYKQKDVLANDSSIKEQLASGSYAFKNVTKNHIPQITLEQDGGASSIR